MEELSAYSYCKIYYMEEPACIFLESGQYTMSSQFQRVFNFALEELKKRNLKAILADNRNMKTLIKKDEEWLLNVWIPKAIEAGFRVNAIVENNEKFVKTSHTDIVMSISKDHKDFFNGKVFNDMDKAKAWIKEMIA